MPVVLLVNLKGGVAKTTSSVALSETLADEGKKVLMIDGDHQCTASELLLGEERVAMCERRKKTLHDLLAAMLDDSFNSHQFEAFIENGASNIRGGMENLSVLPCSIRIDDFSTNIQKARKGFHSNEEFTRIFNRRRQVFRNWLNSRFDYTIVDCPPTISLQIKLLLSVSDGYIVPSIPDRLSVRGCQNLVDRIRRTGIKKPGIGILWSLYRQQDKTHRSIVKDAASMITDFAALPVPFETIIPVTSQIAQAFQEKREFASLSTKYTPAGSRLFKRLCREMAERLNR